MLCLEMSNHILINENPPASTSFTISSTNIGVIKRHNSIKSEISDGFIKSENDFFGFYLTPPQLNPFVSYLTPPSSTENNSYNYLFNAYMNTFQQQLPLLRQPTPPINDNKTTIINKTKFVFCQTLFKQFEINFH